MKWVFEWIRRWWGEKERSVSMSKYLDVVSARAPARALPIAAIRKEAATSYASSDETFVSSNHQR